MKVLLYSHFFYPSLGGIETVSMSLATGFIQKDIQCKVVTTTSGIGMDEFTFEVIRKPDRKRQIELVKWADIILFNGASLALQPWVLLYKKPFVWVHQSYLVSCIDGLGWVDGVKAPLHPFLSIKYHIQIKGWSWGITQGLKLLIKRFVALKLVNKNIAITKWVKTIQPLPRQVLIYNPFPIDKFILTDTVKPEYDFLFLGRIVSEKGVSTLLQALSIVINSYSRSVNLLIIGDGNWKEKMENLSGQLQITQNVTFVGKKSGHDLMRWVAKAKIAVVPSEWYEPMGGVALELMAAGKSLIISEYGGLKECIGDAALTFPNGDDKALAACMIQLLNDEQLCGEQKIEGKKRSELFQPSLFIAQYIDLLKALVNQY